MLAFGIYTGELYLSVVCSIKIHSFLIVYHSQQKWLLLLFNLIIILFCDEQCKLLLF